MDTLAEITTTIALQRRRREEKLLNCETVTTFRDFSVSCVGTSDLLRSRRQIDKFIIARIVSTERVVTCTIIRQKLRQATRLELFMTQSLRGQF